MENSLGDRMKAYEGLSSRKLIPKLPVLIRLDGKAFHTFTRGLDRPYDKCFHQCMWAAAQALCKEIQGCQLAYVQSDEISLLLTDWATYKTSSWFDYKIQKTTSVSAAIATAAFLKAYVNIWGWPNKLPAFDSRVWNLPRHEVNNYFLWRQQDAVRNSIQALGQAHFSHKQLHKKSCNDIQDMLWTLDVNWNDCSTPQKHGVCITKVQNPETKRTNWISNLDIPVFSQDTQYIEKFLTNIFWKEICK
jgi:tRNA(His) guanylyltransferase